MALVAFGVARSDEMLVVPEFEISAAGPRFSKCFNSQEHERLMKPFRSVFDVFENHLFRLIVRGADWWTKSGSAPQISVACGRKHKEHLHFTPAEASLRRAAAARFFAGTKDMCSAEVFQNFTIRHRVGDTCR